MAAAVSDLMVIAACAGRLCDETVQLEKFAPFKCCMHCGSSQGSRVVIKAILTGCPRVILNIEILRKEVNINARLEMLLAIACTVIGLVQMLQTAISRIKIHAVHMKELQKEYPNIKVAVSFISPWRKQSVDCHGSVRVIPGDTSAYVVCVCVCVLAFQLLCCIARLQEPIQELVFDIAH